MVARATLPSFCTEVRSLKALIKGNVRPNEDGTDPAEWDALVVAHDSALTAFVVAAPSELFGAANVVANAIRQMPTDITAIDSPAAVAALEQISHWMDDNCSAG